MRISSSLLLFILTFYSLSIWSQLQEIDSAYTKYFQNTREIPFLHLNKTSFLEGEEIWFQAYVIEQNSKKLHPTTSNLYVSVFDSNGILKLQQLIHVKNGIGYGNIDLDSSFTDKEYFLKASTKWMKNFNEDNAYTQRIKIISDIQKLETTQIIDSDKFFDFQIFPEGGYFIENVLNSCGVLIKDQNGIGQQIENGVVKEFDSNKVITAFETNKLGLGKFVFMPQKGKSYLMEITLKNGSIISKKIDSIKAKGVKLQVNNPNSQFIEISLLTNKSTLHKIRNKSFYIWIHNTNTVYKNKIVFNNKELIKTLLIKNNKLPKGTNIISIFNDRNQPIAERVIFNYSPDLFTNIKVEQEEINSDSLSTNIINQSNKSIYLSASFLPRDTKAYRPSSSIISKFLIEPYVKGSVQNIDYYFTNINRKKLQDLDLLLLSQGWSKYNWKDIFNQPPETEFPFENGIDVKITVDQKIRKNQRIMFFSDQNNLIGDIRKGNNPYLLENSFLKKNSTINFTLNRDFIYIPIEPKLEFSDTKLEDKINLNLFPKEIKKELEISNFERLTKGTEMLDEIIITGKVEKFDNEIRGKGSMLRKYDAKNLVVPSGYLIDYIKAMGKNYQFSRRPLRAVYLNNNRVRGAFEIDYIMMDEIREVALGVPPGEKYRELHIYSYSTKELNKVRVKSKEVEIPVGFENEKSYYEPKYPSYTNKTFNDYGALFWKSDIKVEANQELNINIPLHFQNRVKTIIQGIDEDGKIISKTVWHSKEKTDN